MIFLDESPRPPRNEAQGWSSTGSESAYETIRERRSIGEALASSFEFYSTSPKNARAVGYVSSPENINDVRNILKYGNRTLYIAIVC